MSTRERRRAWSIRRIRTPSSSTSKGPGRRPSTRHVARDHLGAPQASADAFTLLEKAGRLDEGLAGRLRAMVSFRNIVVHEYQKLNLDILRAIVESRGEDFVAFCTALGLRIRA